MVKNIQKHYEVKTRNDEITMIYEVLGKRMENFAKRLCFSKTCSRHFDHDDVMQETFLKMHQSNPERVFILTDNLLDEDGEVNKKASTFIFKIEKNVFINMVKKYKYHVDDIPLENTDELVVDPKNDPVAETIINELKTDILSNALGKLKDEEREVIYELFLSDNTLKKKELAAKHNLTINTYLMRKNRALNHLKKDAELAAYYNDYYSCAHTTFTTDYTSKSYGSKNN